jgi:toxin-antitoxin system PIN domain toxin
MISFFPDLNVWLALSFEKHSHTADAWRWLNRLPEDTALLFSRYTQLGLLRLLTNTAVMGENALTLQGGWMVYDRWLSDRRVQFHPEPRDLDPAFREATDPFSNQRAPKWIGDCYLLAFARESGATLVTFDKALLGLARREDYAAIIPG